MVRNSHHHDPMNTPNAAVEGKSKYARDAWLRALAKTANLAERGEILPQVIDRLATEFGSLPALEDASTAFDFRRLAERVNQYARFAIAQSVGSGDCVALFMNNCVEYVAIWLGLTRAGATVALLNSQLQGEVLAHSINIAAPKFIISGADVAARVSAIRVKLAPRVVEFVLGGSGGRSLEQQLSQFTTEPLGGEVAVPPIDAIALYIYTSGTTGMPKAAKVSHYRLMQWSHWFAGMMDTKPEDRMFNALPLYHSVGGVVATFAPLVNGASVVIRPRFSASDFWRDVAAERCTLFQYIGELCRYLVNSPPQAAERDHALRLACGNGLRPEVWSEFQQRFRIPRILEYYASTEGNFSLYNCEGQVGAIGRIPKFVAARLPVALLRFDVDAGIPVRNAQGFCEPCAVDEVGEAVGRIPGGMERGGRFEGYADREASERKVLRNVFERDDAWYRTGDLMRRDAQGFYYFVDRIGETYRWKGENVSTAEVLSVLAAITGVRDGVVYGVAVPGYDGRAGMAALVVDDKFDLIKFRDAASAALPAYARPVFLRLISSLETTGTFKPRKQDLLAAGFDPALIQDPLFFDDARERAYLPLDSAQFAAIGDGDVRL
jgi:fatty-acyl-CoA synthase